MAEELPKLVLAANDCLMQRSIGSSEETEMESNIWTQSAQVPGIRIINTWQIYKGVWLVLVKTELGNYQILHSTDLRNFSLVFDYASEILNLYWIDDGLMILCAQDDWWITGDTGVGWFHLPHGDICPRARSLAVVPLQEGSWSLVAYGEDHKIYAYNFSPVVEPDPNEAVPEYESWHQVPGVSVEPDPNEVVPEYESWQDVPPWTDIILGGEWVEAYDASLIYSGRWYPAMAGGPVGVLAGVGCYLLRYDPAGGGSWTIIATLPGIIKSIRISDLSRKPTFLVVVEPTAGEDQIDKLYRTDDLGDSLQEILNRIGTLSAVQSVIPTGMSEPKTMFAVLGQRQVGGQSHYKIVEID